MAHLSLTGVSDDGKRLLLADERGHEHTLEVTPGLRAALRGQDSRQLEITMDSVLRPRDIQARIRAGESPEAVAEVARTSVERIMAFVGPVLAERAHVAERAQRSTLRRPAGEAGGTARVLGDAVAAHLRAANVDPETVEWDAWRREDGRWALIGAFSAGARSGIAEFSFDMPGNFVVLDNDDARWLVGDALAPSGAPAALRDDLESARQRRLAPAPAPVAPSIAPASEPEALGDDAIGMVTDGYAGDTPLDAFLETTPDADDPAARHDAEEAADADGPADTADDEEPAVEQTAVRRPVQKKKGRASVPSWDEIMFGSEQP